MSSKTSNLLMGIRSELERIVKAALGYPEEKQRLKDRYKNLEDQLTEVGVRLDDVDKRINRVSNKEEVRIKHKEREEHEDLKKQNTEKLGVAKDQLKKAEDKKAEFTNELNKALAKNKECARLRLDEITKKGDVYKLAEQYANTGFEYIEEYVDTKKPDVLVWDLFLELDKQYEDIKQSVIYVQDKNFGYAKVAEDE